MDADRDHHDEQELSSDNDQHLSTPRAATTRVPGKTTKGNMEAGKLNYTREELLSLLSIMERILPIGTEEWDQVLLEHSEQYSGRDINSITQAYNSLHRKRIPIGDPSIPPEVLAAKRVKFKIGFKADIGGAEGETFSLETGFGSVPHQRPGKDANQELLDLWRIEMTKEREERRAQEIVERKERRARMIVEREERRAQMIVERQERRAQMIMEHQERRAQMIMDHEQRLEELREEYRARVKSVVKSNERIGNYNKNGWDL